MGISLLRKFIYNNMNKILKNIKISIENEFDVIYNNQIKELSELIRLSNLMDLDPKIIKLDNKIKSMETLVKNQKDIIKLMNDIRIEWKTKCFMHTVSTYSSPSIIEDLSENHATLKNHNIKFIYEREILDTSEVATYDNGNYETFSVLTSSGMSAIKLVFDTLLSLNINKGNNVLFSAEYFETIHLFSNLEKISKINFFKYLKGEKFHIDKKFNIFYFEHVQANFNLDKITIFDMVKLIKKYKKGITYLILDNSYVGNSFNIKSLLSRLIDENIIIFNLRSLIKLDQEGLEISNGGLIDIYIPDRLKKISESFKTKINKVKNILGYNLTYYEYCLLDNGFTLSKNSKYAHNYIVNCELLYSEIPKKLNFVESVNYTKGAPMIYLNLGGGKYYCEKFINFIKKIYKSFDINLDIRASFGFRNFTIDYFGFLGTENYAVKITPGIIWGLNLHIFLSILNELSDKNINEIINGEIE